jgi:hypothetical protein
VQTGLPVVVAFALAGAAFTTIFTEAVALPQAPDAVTV